jgi:hypothetical protein
LVLGSGLVAGVEESPPGLLLRLHYAVLI